MYAFESVEEAGDSLETIDLDDGHYLAAFSDRGEIVDMTGGNVYITFRPTGRFAHEELAALLRQSRGPLESMHDPHTFALAVWLQV